MTYYMLWQKVPDRKTILSRDYQSLEEALDAADYSCIGGPSAVEISVRDGNGSMHFRRIVGNCPSP